VYFIYKAQNLYGINVIFYINYFYKTNLEYHFLLELFAHLMYKLRYTILIIVIIVLLLYCM